MAYRYGQVTGEHVVSFAFASVNVGTDTNFAGGYYEHGSAADDFSPQITHGTADNAYGAHVFIVVFAGDGAGNTEITVGGTSWDPDTGTRTPGDSEVLTIIQSEAANTVHQTVKAWIGQVTLTKTAGNDVLCNYGLVDTWIHAHEDWSLEGFKVEWQGDGNDAGTNVVIYHHQPTGTNWTYNAAAPADPPMLYDMHTDYNTEFETNNNIAGNYERHGLTDVILGSIGEGVIVAGLQTGSRPFGIATAALSVRHP